ncbi:MAG: chromophore lyase CpcT/CpeT [Deltaproteobacteria bacterium]|nr:chromophore lyase CpcT/CpeT [Deltaproteobacteria bacterium]
MAPTTATKRLCVGLGSMLAAACAAPAQSAPDPATPAATTPPTVAAPAFSDDVEQLVALMTGSFSSRLQAQTDPSYFDIRLHMIPLWTDRDDARWLYVEQAVATAQDAPYRQRVYRVAALEDGTVESAVYTMVEPERFAFAWRDPSTLDALRFEDITRKDGCEVILRVVEPGHYSGSTGERSCKSELRGASYAHSQVTVTEGGVDSWDRGFDDAGQQVWGATQGGYEFRADDPQAPAVGAER